MNDLTLMMHNSGGDEKLLAGEHAQAGHPDSLDMDGPGSRIGRYRLLERIGEGGCGVIYLAEQSEPVRRKVALKIIRLGLDTESVIARFESERQSLALMDPRTSAESSTPEMPVSTPAASLHSNPA